MANGKISQFTHTQSSILWYALHFCTHKFCVLTYFRENLSLFVLYTYIFCFCFFFCFEFSNDFHPSSETVMDDHFNDNLLMNMNYKCHNFHVRRLKHMTVSKKLKSNARVSFVLEMALHYVVQRHRKAKKKRMQFKHLKYGILIHIRVHTNKILYMVD